MSSDVQLLERWRSGDQAAGSRLFEQYFAPLFRFFRNKTEGGVEDLVQETFLACVRGRDRIEDDAKLRGYLFGTARHVLYRHYEARARDEPIDFGVSSLRDLGTTPSGFIAKNEEQRLLTRALRRLPVDLQIAIELYYFEDLSGPQLALALDVPEGTARSRIRRATERLREVLAELAESKALLESTIQDLDVWTRQVRDLLSAEARKAS